MKRRVVTLAGWSAVAVIAGVLAATRYRMANSSPERMDFDAIFLPAAQAVAAGQSPYGTTGYVYSPLYAVALAPISHQPWVAEAATAVMVLCGVAACVLLARVFGSDLRHPLAVPAVAAGAVGTLLYSWPATLNLWGLYPDMVVLLCLAGAVAARGVTGGFALGAAAAIKTWPAVLGVWLLRAPLSPRLRAWAGVGIAAVVALGSCLLVGGPPAMVDMVRRAYEFRSQPFVAYSTSGAAKLLFTRGPNAEPLLESPVLSVVALVVLTLWVLVLLLVALRRPGDARVSLFNITFAVILLLPVSHLAYLMLALPALWFWVSRVLADPRNRGAWLASVTLGVWWVLTMRVLPASDPSRQIMWQSFLLVFGSTLLAATVSVLAASRLPADPAGPPQRDAARSTGSREIR